MAINNSLSLAIAPCRGYNRGMSAQTPLTVHRISAAETRPLRSAILRPTSPPESCIFPGDDAPVSYHAGAFFGADVGGVVTLLHQPAPFAAELGLQALDAWQLRGMAVSAHARRTGCGRALVQALLAYAAGQGAGLVWCYARTAVQPFYAALGFQPHGAIFDVPVSGPHILMWQKMNHRPPTTDE